VAKPLKEDWLIVLWQQLQLKTTFVLFKSFIADVLKSITGLINKI